MPKKSKKIVIPTEDEVAQYADKALGAEDPPSSPAEVPEDESAQNDEVGTSAAGGAAEELPEAEQWKEKCLRAKAELANYQRRMQKDHAESLRYANASLVRALLPILDDLERVVESAPSHQDSAGAVLDGVRLTLENCLKVLRDCHVERIEAEGKPFDPKVHEAVMEQPSPKHAERTVLQEVAKGYRLHDRILRPAKVIVSKPVDTEDTDSAEPDSADTDG